MASEVDQLLSRAQYLADEFKGGGESCCIKEAIDLAHQALERCPLGHSERCVSLTWLAVHLNTRCSRLGDIKDMNEAVSLSRDALLLCPPGHPGRSSSLHHLGFQLYSRYNWLGRLDDLDEAITLACDALLPYPPGHPERSIYLHNLATYLFLRYNQLGRLDDLDKAITLGRDMLLLLPPGDPERPIYLHNLGGHLSSRYKQLGKLDDLDEAITLGRDMLLLFPPRHPDRSLALNNLGARLCCRYERFGGLDDVDEAITLSRDALLLCPPGHPGRPLSLNNLGGYLSLRYRQLGRLDDLDEAITLARDMLLLTPPWHPERSTFLHNLGAHLSFRYKRLGGLDDLDEAITLGRAALLLRPPGHPDQSMVLNYLGSHLSSRYNCLGRVDDLDEAIVLGRAALFLRPPGHPNRSDSLSNLGTYLSSRYDCLGRLVDLDEAITLGRAALLLCPPGNPARSTSLNNLGTYLSSRYKRLGGLDDLDEAVTLDRDALLLSPPGHPRRPYSLHRLASRLSIRYTNIRHEVDQKELFSIYIQLSDVQQITSLVDLEAARAWITEAEHSQHSSTLLAYQTALRFLVHHLSTLPALPQHLLNVKNLTSSLAVDALSACIRHHDPTRAVELLEQGRGVFWGQLTRLHSSHELADVATSGSAGKTLSDEFNRVTSLIRSAINSPGPNQHNQLCTLNVKLQAVISEIRQLPHFSRFLLPPAFSYLQQAASGGPIIIVNASTYSCDALIVLVDRDPIHVPLSAVTREGARDLSSRLRTLTVRAKSSNVLREIGGLLRELWDSVVSPIVDVLRTIVPLQSRIWWCPTAEFTLLPLHAAGPCRLDEQNLPDLYVSSYTPSLSALIRARRQVQLKTERIGERERLAPANLSPIPVGKQESNPPKHERISNGERHTPFFNFPPGVPSRFRWHDLLHSSKAKKDFLSTLSSPFRLGATQAGTSSQTNVSEDGSASVSSEPTEIVCLNPARGSQQTRFIAIGQANATGENELKSVADELTTIGRLLDGRATFTRIEGSQSSISRAIDELGKNEWVHLACHGIPNEDQPFDSAFALHDGHLTIERIIRCELENPEFAYLSACHTTVGDKESPDEALHLAAAMQFVGFRSVIGTMWAVDDGQTNKITSTFYKHLIGDSGRLDYTRAALALNLTVKELNGIVPGDQRILYIHIGA